MKKSFLLTALLGFMGYTAQAADLYVREAGAGGAYSSISAAITAAADGDRIIIKPKAGGMPYIENLTINKSLSFVCETNFTKYLVQGNLSITPAAGRTVSIFNLNTTGSVTVTSATTGGRTVLNVFNSTVAGNIESWYTQTSIYASGNTVTGSIILTHGRITANKCNNIVLTGTSAETSLATDDIEIIANAISYTGDAININQRNYNFKLLNNYMATGYVYISGIKTGSNNEIRNNVINASTSNPIYITLSTGNTGFISVLNNILNYTSTTKINNTSGTSLATVYAFYNMSSNSFSTTSVSSSSNNVGNASLTFNDTTYTVSGANVNAGYPEDDYADTDLTRNDIGNWGGSHSWGNYWPTNVGNKPQVNYLNTPRRIYTGTSTMNASGAGHSK